MIEVYIPLKLNKVKGLLSFWVEQASYEKVTKRSMVK